MKDLKKVVLAAVKAKGAVAFDVRDAEVVICNLKYLQKLVKKATKNQNNLVMLVLKKRSA